jgi:hypothetical protein
VVPNILNVNCCNFILFINGENLRQNFIVLLYIQYYKDKNKKYLCKIYQTNQLLMFPVKLFGRFNFLTRQPILRLDSKLPTETFEVNDKINDMNTKILIHT